MDRVAFAKQTVARYRDEIVQVMTDIIRIPSQNQPPIGYEKNVQEYMAAFLRRAGLAAELYQPDHVPGLVEHPDFWPGRDYANRPNLCSTLPSGSPSGKGNGGGRSLLLTGHADTVVLGDQEWTYPPFGAEIHDGKLYGLGAVDMKGQMAAMLVLFKALAEQSVPLRGRLAYECVVDEEEAGVNATLAGRLRDGPMDAAIVPEVSGLDIYPAIRGALILNFTFSAQGTWLETGSAGGKQADAVEQIGLFLAHLDELRAARRRHAVPEIYRSYPDPFPVTVTKVYAGGWGFKVPIAVPPVGHIQLIVETLTGDEQAGVWKEVEDWLNSVIERHPAAFPIRPRMELGLRWMYPTQINPGHPLVTTLQDCVVQATGRTPTVKGAPYQCDMWALHRNYAMPAVVFGPRGGNSHAADEYIEMESVFAFAESLLLFILEWCGVDE
jgi:acetylornithine deacetylase